MYQPVENNKTVLISKKVEGNYLRKKKVLKKPPTYVFDLNDADENSQVKASLKPKPAEKKSTSAFSGNVVWALLKTFWPYWLLYGSMRFFSSILMFTGPKVMDLLLTYITNYENEPVWKGYVYAGILFGGGMTESILMSQSEFGMQTMAMRVRAALISLIYKKVKLQLQRSFFIYF